MLSYRHGFHAGNFADVLKHAVLVRIVQSLLRKPAPFFYLDTHAGAGRYDLESAMAKKNREHRSGIERLWKLTSVPPELEDYLAAVRALNPGGKLRHYPGSPLIVRHFLRSGDRMALCELHGTEIHSLRAVFGGERRITVDQMDGYQGLKAFLPPAERRGLVLCDPPFELRNERERMVEAAAAAWKRWPTGIFAYWYPIQDRRTADWLHRKFRRTGIDRLLALDLSVCPETGEKHMNGSGLVIVNPPWHLDEHMKTVLPWLHAALSPQGEGGWRIEWLAGETA
ncbi:23S rRNA (adenine(2030)-N(6))-methyltransferase RlmJ [Methylococcus geothermalis]|uniref:Ribosomal RNA large subunit methyltransferase J n=1 Tax=Methylococcus geothermalis TaxID=2681310 RepID=A0A858QAW7_9GAMM|nr:23S rRNA (adenine(2030)-N(6))-methyltransferase RlmJ [Methylococcus geothermalis]QJD30865.1 23S rRNA (adenine(2030)-N(6))-methyltransferase RlmJ [Methylococcus geothermalis]